MPLPVHARIQAAQTFLANVQSAHAFMREQDASTADARYSALLAQLKEARGHLRWSPSAGRPARFLASHSAQGQALAIRAKAIATAQGVPELRELVVKPHVLLYAHNIDRVVLLALKHERELIFQPT